MEKVIQVDFFDQEIGVLDKQEAHELGILHRAFSVFIFNLKGEFLLQKRATSKYHSGGLWTNTCCSHPRPNESTHNAAIRRLKEEMGIECDLQEYFSVIYKQTFKNGLTEHEYDHVLIGYSDAEPFINKEEVEDWRYVSFNHLKMEMKNKPENFTYWFQICLEKVEPFILK